MADTFTYEPTEAHRVNQPRQKRTQFGNGYVQKYEDGINANLDKWELTFKNRTSIIGAIDTFLAGNYNTFFFWTPPAPSATVKSYECVQWKLKPLKGGVYMITATFVEWAGLTDQPLEMIDNLEMADNLEMK